MHGKGRYTSNKGPPGTSRRTDGCVPRARVSVTRSTWCQDGTRQQSCTLWPVLDCGDDIASQELCELCGLGMSR